MLKKSILFVCASLMWISCNSKKETIIPPDSVYNLKSEWENQHGKKMFLADLKDKTVVLVMIYTSCQTACPILTAQMGQIAKRVGPVDPEKVKYVLVSIDPEHDDPKRMREYLKTNKFTGKEWLFLRGSEDHTRELANALAVKYKEISPIDFSHSNIITVFNKNGTMAFQKEGLAIDVDGTVEEVKKQLTK